MSEAIPTRWNRPIFVASMGRSGSTLLQRVLNLHPEITIWGEHGGFLSGLLQSYEAASAPDTVRNLEAGYAARDQVIGELADKSSFTPWVSPFAPAELEDRVEEMIRGLFTSGLGPSVRWGFKEIRYGKQELVTLMEMFPEAHLVVLARDLPGFAQSRFFAFGNTAFDFDSEDGRKAIAERLTKMSGNWIRRYQAMVTVQERYPDRTSLIAYRDLVAGSPRPTALFEELGEMSPTQQALDAVLGEVTGSSYKFNDAARKNREELLTVLNEAVIDWGEYRRLAEILGCDER